MRPTDSVESRPTRDVSSDLGNSANVLTLYQHKQKGMSPSPSHLVALPHPHRYNLVLHSY